MASYRKNKAFSKRSGSYGGKSEEPEIDNSNTHVGFWKDNSPFSNWHLAKYTYDGHRFANSEQGMMWGKSVLFGDKDMEKQILETTDPKTVKALGRKVKRFDEKTWKKNRTKIMFQHCYAKFSQNPTLKKHLYNTGAKMLVEASPYDKVWGIGLRWHEARYIDPKKWPTKKGEKENNLLGKSLVAVREALRDEDVKKDTGTSHYDHREMC